MVSFSVIDHVSWDCQKCGNTHVEDIRVPCHCPNCVGPSPYYISAEHRHGPMLVLYKRTPAAAPLLVCMAPVPADQEDPAYAQAVAQLTKIAALLFEVEESCQ